MPTKNNQATRFYSDKQEKEVATVVNGVQTANSGAGKFTGGDVLAKKSSMLVECKCTMSEKESFSVKKEWFIKNKEEAFTQRVSNSVIAFNFGPGQDSYYVIDKRLMKFLVEKLEEFYKDEQ